MLNKDLFLSYIKPQLLKSVSGTGYSVELFSDGSVYTVTTYIEEFSTKKASSFFSDYKEADMAFQDAVLSTSEKGTLH